MKTRKYTYTCEHPGSDVIITSDKPMNRPICPLCAAVMRSQAYFRDAVAPEKRMDINDLPVEDIDPESAQAGREVWERVSGAPNIRVQGRLAVTETPHSPDKRLMEQIGSDKQNFRMENTMTKYHCKLISEVDFYFESEEEIKHSYDPANYPEQVKVLIEQASERLGKDRFIVATMEKRRQGTFQNSSED